MNREEMLSKLKSIKPTACPTVMTFDMGLEFEFMDSTGASTILGSIGDWPLWKFPRLSAEELVVLNEKIEKNSLVVNDFTGPLKCFVQEILEYHNDADLNDLFKGLTSFPESNDSKEVYINCDLKSWELEIEFFGTKEEIEKDFFGQFQIYAKWDEMDESELENYCNLIEERGEGVPFYTPQVGEND